MKDKNIWKRITIFREKTSNTQTQFPRESFRSTSHYKISEIPPNVGPAKFWYYQNANCKNSAFAILATIYDTTSSNITIRFIKILQQQLPVGVLHRAGLSHRGYTKPTSGHRLLIILYLIYLTLGVSIQIYTSTFTWSISCSYKLTCEVEIKIFCKYVANQLHSLSRLGYYQGFPEKKLFIFKFASLQCQRAPLFTSVSIFYFSDKNLTYKLLLSGHPWKKRNFLEPSDHGGGDDCCQG